MNSPSVAAFPSLAGTGLPLVNIFTSLVAAVGGKYALHDSLDCPSMNDSDEALTTFWSAMWSASWPAIKPCMALFKLLIGVNWFLHVWYWRVNI